jgi:hypothetical protein
MSGKSPGQELRVSLPGTLPPGMVWTAQELQTLDSIQDAADRLTPLRARFRKLAADPKSTESQLATIQSALHQLESDLFRWINKLDPTQEVVKSARHVHAANSRWSRTSGRAPY